MYNRHSDNRLVLQKYLLFRSLFEKSFRMSLNLLHFFYGVGRRRDVFLNIKLAVKVLNIRVVEGEGEYFLHCSCNSFKNEGLP